MSKFQQNTNAVMVASFPVIDSEREVCQLRATPKCEGYTRLMPVETPAGVVQACPTCARERVV